MYIKSGSVFTSTKDQDISVVLNVAAVEIHVGATPTVIAIASSTKPFIEKLIFDALKNPSIAVLDVTGL